MSNLADTEFTLEALSNGFADETKFVLGYVTDGNGRHSDEDGFITFDDIEISVSGPGADMLSEFIVLACNEARRAAQKREKDRNATEARP